jgi:hypothetical protein
MIPLEIVWDISWEALSGMLRICSAWGNAGGSQMRQTPRIAY